MGLGGKEAASEAVYDKFTGYRRKSIELDLKRLSCSERERKIPVAWSPVLFPGRGKTRL